MSDSEDEPVYVSLQGGPAQPRSASPVMMQKSLDNLVRGGISSSSSTMESMVFEESESLAWKSHHLKRFLFNAKQTKFFTDSRRTTVYKWALVILVGAVVALIGLAVTFFTHNLTDIKYSVLKSLADQEKFVWAYFSFLLITAGYASVAGALIALEPNAAGSGIAQIKAYLNGVNLHKVVRIRTLFAKVIGMVFSVSCGLPLGKEGPMIHAGSIVGAALSQGKGKLFNFDTSWTKTQDLRNDRTKRDFVSFGAAAGVAAAFSAPIGGVLFVIEEGASFWSATLTLRAFFCAMVTELTINLITTAKSKTLLGLDEPTSMFDFGDFDDFNGYHTWELSMFLLLGAMGGVLGALFNHISLQFMKFRRYGGGGIGAYADDKRKRFLELIIFTIVCSTVAFAVPMFGDSCTDRPTDMSGWTEQAANLEQTLMRLNCPEGQYNELASLYLQDADSALRTLFHYRDQPGIGTTFSIGSLLLFFIPYYLMAMFTAGLACPAGLFVPTLVSGAAFGRFIGALLNAWFPGQVTDVGTYSLMGAAAILGGMSRMTIAGTLILLEACGNSEYLLPLMLVFAAARYTGNVFNKAMYDQQILYQNLPYLDTNMPNYRLLKYQPVSDIMAKPARTIFECNKVGAVYDLLRSTTHNAFPVISRNGLLRGYIMRKTLCSLLKLKAFATPVKETVLAGEDVSQGFRLDANRLSSGSSGPSKAASGHSLHSISNSALGSVEGDEPRHLLQLNSHNIIFFETIERSTYPKYPPIESIDLSIEEKESWLDVRMYMDRAPHVLHRQSSIQRAYRYFRTMGLRHIIITDGSHRVCGMITRKDLTEEHLGKHWEAQEASSLRRMRTELPRDEYEDFYYTEADIGIIELPDTKSTNANIDERRDSNEFDPHSLSRERLNEGTSRRKIRKVRVVNQVFPARDLDDHLTLEMAQDNEYLSTFRNSISRKNFYEDKERERKTAKRAGLREHYHESDTEDESTRESQTPLYVGSLQPGNILAEASTAAFDTDVIAIETPLATFIHDSDSD